MLLSRLAAEPDAPVQMTLVVCIAQHDKDVDRVTESLAWLRGLWSDSSASMGVRLGAVIAWLNLTEEEVPPKLRSELSELPEPAVLELAHQLPWIWWLRRTPGGVAQWWQRLTADPSGTRTACF